MKFITFVVLLIVLTYTAAASALRNRENFNVLIPNNDVGRHEMLKELLAEYDIDPSELMSSDYVDTNDPKAERIVQYNSLPIIQHAELNREDSYELDSTTRNPSITIQQDDFSKDDSEELGGSTRSYTSTRGAESNMDDSREANAIQHAELNRDDSEEQHDSSRSSSATQRFLTSTRRSSTTQRPSTTTKKPSTTTTKKSTTTTRRSGGSSEEKPKAKSVSSTLLPILSSSTSNMKEDTTESTLFTLSTTTTPNPFPSSPSFKADCLLGKVSEVLQWVDVNGVLQKNFIMNSEDMRDLECLDKSNTSETELVAPVEVTRIFFNNNRVTCLSMNICRCPS